MTAYSSGAAAAARAALGAAAAVPGITSNAGEKFMDMSFDERFATCRGVVERMHPGKSGLLEKPLTVSWTQTPWSEGIAAFWTPAQRLTDYAELARPEGRVFFAGEHLSYIGAWQEGAALSAFEAIRLLATRAAGDKVTAPKRT